MSVAEGNVAVLIRAMKRTVKSLFGGAEGNVAVLIREQSAVAIYYAGHRDFVDEFVLVDARGAALSEISFQQLEFAPCDHLLPLSAESDETSWHELTLTGSGPSINASTGRHSDHIPVAELHGVKGGPDNISVTFVDPIHGDLVPICGGTLFTISGRFATHRCRASLVAHFFDEKLEAVGTIMANVPSEIEGGRGDSSYFHASGTKAVPESARYARVIIAKGVTEYGDDSWLFFYNVTLVDGHAGASVLHPAVRKAKLLANRRQEKLYGARIDLSSDLVPKARLRSAPEVDVTDISPAFVANTEESIKPRIRFKSVWGTNLRVCIVVVIYNNSPSEVKSSLLNIQRAISFATTHLEHIGVKCHFDVIFYDNSEAQANTSALISSELYRRDGTNCGFGGTHNKLMAEQFAAGADYYVAFNPDGYPRFDCVAEMLLQAQHTGAGLVEAMQFPFEHPKAWDNVTFQTNWCSGAALLISRDAYFSTGGFDPNIEMYCEDVDLSWRVRRAGIQICIAPKALFFHDVTDRASASVRRHMLLSGRYLGRKWGSQSFEDKMALALISEGFVARADHLPKIETYEDCSAARIIADFDNDLVFARPRW